MKKRTIYYMALLFIVLTLAMVFKPVPVPSDPSECEIAQGKLIDIQEGVSYDVIFKIDGYNSKFYINRGLENGLSLADLEKLVGQEITIKYPQYWTPLDPSKNSIHASQLEHGGEVLYTEIKS